MAAEGSGVAQSSSVDHQGKTISPRTYRLIEAQTLHEVSQGWETNMTEFVLARHDRVFAPRISNPIGPHVSGIDTLQHKTRESRSKLASTSQCSQIAS